MTTIKLDKTKFKLLAAVADVASNDCLRKNIQHVLFEVIGNTLRLVSTDGHRIVTCDLRVDGTHEDVSFIVHKRSIKGATAAFKLQKDDFIELIYDADSGRLHFLLLHDLHATSDEWFVVPAKLCGEHNNYDGFVRYRNVVSFAPPAWECHDIGKIDTVKLMDLHKLFRLTRYSGVASIRFSTQTSINRALHGTQAFTFNSESHAEHKISITIMGVR